MATNNFNQPQQIPYMGNVQQTIPIQYPYGVNNGLLMNTPYENYMGRQITGQQQVFNQNQFLKCRPVASKEQARAFQIDLDGSLWVFTDVGNEKIYTKQINTDGTATFKTYSFIQDEEPAMTAVTSNDYVTRDEFTKALQKIMAAMQVGNSQGPVPAPANNAHDSNSSVLVF